MHDVTNGVSKTGNRRRMILPHSSSVSSELAAEQQWIWLHGGSPGSLRRLLKSTTWMFLGLDCGGLVIWTF